MNVKEKAIKWWGQKTKKGIFVVSTKEIPTRLQREVLVKERFLCPLTKSYWILKKPEDEIQDIFPLLYWPIIRKVLSDYDLWSVWGKSALEIHNGSQAPQKLLRTKTKTVTNRKTKLYEGFEISLVTDRALDTRLIKKLKIADVKIPVESPEKVLIDVSRLQVDEEMRNFIAGTKFDVRVLDALYAKNPKPIVFKRLIKIAKEVGRLDLVAAFDKTIATHTHYAVVKRERIEPELAKPAVILPPWVIRQESQIQEFEKVLEKNLLSKIERVKKYPLSKLLAQAKEHKRYDTYHSTTLEGYRITPEEVESLLSGVAPKKEKGKGDKYLEGIKNRMAIIGYSEAFDFTIKKIQEDFGRPKVSEDLIKDTFYNLFKPSADAKIIDYLTLVSYRTIPAFIRGTSYVPPSYEKLPELMASYVESINNVNNPVIKAILAHFFFVTIHPYGDGNGRTARLLMNYLFLTSGYPWVTIRADQRNEYFEALREGQTSDDILPFGKFILSMLKKSATLK